MISRRDVVKRVLAHPSFLLTDCITQGRALRLNNSYPLLEPLSALSTPKNLISEMCLLSDKALDYLTIRTSEGKKIDGQAIYQGVPRTLLRSDLLEVYHIAHLLRTRPLLKLIENYKAGNNPTKEELTATKTYRFLLKDALQIRLLIEGNNDNLTIAKVSRFLGKWNDCLRNVPPSEDTKYVTRELLSALRTFEHSERNHPSEKNSLETKIQILRIAEKLEKNSCPPTLNFDRFHDVRKKLGAALVIFRMNCIANGISSLEEVSTFKNALELYKNMGKRLVPSLRQKMFYPRTNPIFKMAPADQKIIRETAEILRLVEIH
jgi:hypothetical protein